jgi:hypothetical protein
MTAVECVSLAVKTWYPEILQALLMMHAWTLVIGETKVL